MTNPPFPEPPAPDSSNPGVPPAATPPPPPAPVWDTAPRAVPNAAQNAGYPAATPTPPGRVLSIVGLVLAFLIAPVGLIISIVALVKSNKAGQPKGLAIAGIVIGAVVTIFWVILLIVLFAALAALFGMCAELGQGVWEVDGVTYTCG